MEVKVILIYYWYVFRMIAKFKYSYSPMYYTSGKLSVLPIPMADGILSNLVNVNSKDNYGIATIYVCAAIIVIHSMLSGTWSNAFFSVNVSLIGIYSSRAFVCENVITLSNNIKLRYSGRMSRVKVTRYSICGIFTYGTRLWISLSERLWWLSGYICYSGIKIMEIKVTLIRY